MVSTTATCILWHTGSELCSWSLTSINTLWKKSTARLTTSKLWKLSFQNYFGNPIEYSYKAFCLIAEYFLYKDWSDLIKQVFVDIPVGLIICFLQRIQINSTKLSTGGWMWKWDTNSLTSSNQLLPWREGH